MRRQASQQRWSTARLSLVQLLAEARLNGVHRIWTAALTHSKPGSGQAIGEQALLWRLPTMRGHGNTVYDAALAAGIGGATSAHGKTTGESFASALLAQRAIDRYSKPGVRLLARTTRSVAPTEVGAKLLRSLDSALADIAAGVAGLADAGDRVSGSLRITTFAYPARTVLEPRLPSFLLQHPDVRIEVNVDSGLTDLIVNGFDAGIRFGETVDRDMIAVRVGPDLRKVVVGTPDYFRRRPPPQTPADLAPHDCAGYRLATSGGLLRWEFERNGRALNVRAPASLVVKDGGLAEAAVRAGAGLGYLLEEQVAETWRPVASFRCWRTGARRSQAAPLTTRAVVNRRSRWSP